MATCWSSSAGSTSVQTMEKRLRLSMRCSSRTPRGLANFTWNGFRSLKSISSHLNCIAAPGSPPPSGTGIARTNTSAGRPICARQACSAMKKSSDASSASGSSAGGTIQVRRASTTSPRLTRGT